MNDWRRTAIGVLAIALLTAGVLASWLGDGEFAANLAAAGLRCGGVLAVLWLALPDLASPKNRWWLLMLLAACVAVIVLPRWIPWGKLLPALAAAWGLLMILRPRRRQKASHGGTESNHGDTETRSSARRN
ncbi:MAG: hypothetical protein JSS27_10325 [Planctomycetes bacterium]|nr:hypothetical protein [Planctomycetota bacterium]